MIISLRHKAASFSRSSFIFPPISAPNTKWVSTATTKTSLPPPQSEPICHLRAFSDIRIDYKNPSYELAVVRALKACASLLSLSQGQQIHSVVFKTGLETNYVRNSLINMYAKCRALADARVLFDSCTGLGTVPCNIMIAANVRLGRLSDAHNMFVKMPVKDCVSYTTMMMGFAQNDFFVEALEIFKDMRWEGLVPNEVTLSTVISACLNLGGIWDCRMLHGLVIKLLLDVHVLVSTNLVHMYCACSSLEEARKLFDKMPDRNVVSWNVMLNGYAKAGLVDMARELFERFPFKDVVSWGTMIDGYVQGQRFDEAFMMYQTMVRASLEANDIMIVNLISACGQSGSTREGGQLHATIVKRGFDCYEFIQATIIHFYAACGMVDLACLQFEIGIKEHLASCNALIAGFIQNGLIDQAKQMFDLIPERNVFSWTAMISGYTQNEQPHMALEFFHEMVSNGIKPNEITMVSVFSAIASLGSVKEGKWAHEYVLYNSIPLNDNLNASIIDMYAKCGSISTALDVFYQIRDNASTVSPWNAIICGLAMHGHANLSLEIFHDLQKRHIKLNSITFIGVLIACCHGGLVEQGEKHFKSMKSVYNVEPTVKHYGCMVDLLGRAGRLQEAEEMIRNMPMKADVVIWGTLLAACKTHRNVEIGERAAQSLALLQPSHGAGRVLLSNIYADAGRWDDVFLVRREMHSQKMKKLPGCSVV